MEKKKFLKMNIELGGVTPTQKALFAKHLSVMLHAGMPITEALQLTVDSSRGKLKRVVSRVLDSVRSGQSLSKSLALFPDIFSGFVTSAVRAGESSGTLSENLESVALELEKDRALRQKIRGAMLYPMVILAAALVLGLVLVFVVLPKITPLFEGLSVELPFTTRALIGFSHIVEDSGFVLFTSLSVFIFFTVWILRRRFTRPFTHKLILITPLMGGISRNANLARFTRTLGLLIKSGIPIDEALDIVKSTLGNYYYRQALEHTQEQVRMGTQLSDSLAKHSHLFPLITTRMIAVGEASGKFEETLSYLAEFYEGKVDTATKSLATTIEPVLLIGIGLVVGFLAIAIITPIYNITGNIRG